MKYYSFIDFGLKDFLRDNNGKVIRKQFAFVEAAEDWLLTNGEDFGWTNTGIRYWCWDDEE